MTESSPNNDFEGIFQPTHDEQARQSFVGTIRKHAIIDLRRALESRYEQHIKPRLKAGGNAPGNWQEIEAVLATEPVYRHYSSVRYNAQEMCFLSVQPTVERNLQEMIDAGRRARKQQSAGGSLQLDADLAIPKYVAQLDVHLVPGYTHAEHTADDLAQGAVVNFGGRVFTSQHPFRRTYGAVGESVSHWIRRAFPDLKPHRVLDMGTCSGKNLLPFAAEFPDAELYGIDVGAPVLRYGHAFAENEGITAHFSQQNAEQTNFEDGMFDVITSSFFLHEVPVKTTRQILAECLRLLAPGGVMVHMELPNEAAVSDYENFFWNWDTKNNNEPFYTDFRSQDFKSLCRDAGFGEDNCFARLIPDLPSQGVEAANACIAGERETPRHGLGGWFVFGARKSAS